MCSFCFKDLTINSWSNKNYRLNLSQDAHTLITSKMKQIISNYFGSIPNDYVETCQNDVANSFCQTWTLHLLAQPDFKPPESIRERFSIILSIYKCLLKSVKGKRIYTKFLKT